MIQFSIFVGKDMKNIPLAGQLLKNSKSPKIRTQSKISYLGLFAGKDMKHTLAEMTGLRVG
jgi:hypothetical protein